MSRPTVSAEKIVNVDFYPLPFHEKSYRVAAFVKVFDLIEMQRKYAKEKVSLTDGEVKRNLKEAMKFAGSSRISRHLEELIAVLNGN